MINSKLLALFFTVVITGIVSYFLFLSPSRTELKPEENNTQKLINIEQETAENNDDEKQRKADQINAEISRSLRFKQDKEN